MSSYIEAIGQASTASNASSVAAADDTTSMGKEDFLTLLVAQLQNQDPLNPDDATEFTAQLAQFSSLEQLFNLNESVDNMAASTASSDRLSTLTTIGKEVAYHGDSFKFSGDPVEIGYQLDGLAANVTLSMQQNGATVASLKGTDLTEGSHFMTWNGLTTDGKVAPVGDYRVVISAMAVDGESVAAAPVIKSEVTGVDMEGETGGILITQAGSVKFSEILGVYEPAARVSSAIAAEEENGDEDTQNKLAALTENVSEIADIL